LLDLAVDFYHPKPDGVSTGHVSARTLTPLTRHGVIAEIRGNLDKEEGRG